MIEIDVDKNRPKNFASKEEANDWEEKTLRDILRFKKLVEDGKFVPEEVVQRLQAKGQLISKCPFFLSSNPQRWAGVHTHQSFQ